MNKKLLKKIISSMSLLGMGASGNAYASNSSQNNILTNFVNQNSSSGSGNKLDSNQQKNKTNLSDYDILNLALDVSLKTTTIHSKKSNENNSTGNEETKRSTDGSYENNHNVEIMPNPQDFVENQKLGAINELDQWTYMTVAFKAKHFEVTNKLVGFGFKDLLKLKKNYESYLNYINNFLEKENEWDELILDGVTISRNDEKSKEIQHYLKLFKFYNHFELINSEMEHFKNAENLLNDSHLFSLVKGDVEKYWEANGTYLPDQPEEFYPWAWINIIFGEANLEWRGAHISLKKEDPTQPLNRIKSQLSQLNKKQKYDQNGATLKKALIVELH